MNLIQNFLKSICLEGATKTISSAKSPPQQYWVSKYTPYLLQLCIYDNNNKIK